MSTPPAHVVAQGMGNIVLTANIIAKEDGEGDDDDEGEGGSGNDSDNAVAGDHTE